jgi:hypothetical protein
LSNLLEKQDLSALDYLRIKAQSVFNSQKSQIL